MNFYINCINIEKFGFEFYCGNLCAGTSKTLL